MSDCIESRQLSAALVDSTLLIDPGPQALDALREYGVDPAGVRYIINTHRHSNHYDETTVTVLQNTGAALTDLAAGEK